MSTRRQFLFRSLAASATAIPVLAQRGPWEYLGESNVDGAIDHDRIVVGQSRGVFRAIRLHVDRGPVRFDRVTIEFGNGERREIPIAAEIRAGGQTRVIHLPGERRYIAGVSFWYRRGSWGGNRPKVRLFGLR